MGRTVKNFDFNNLFMDNQTDAATRQEIARSPYVGVIIAAYNLVNGGLRVGRVQRVCGNVQSPGPVYANRINVVNLVTPVGLPVARININSVQNTFDICYDAASGGMSENLSTNNFRYMKNKLMSRGDITQRFIDRVNANNGFFSACVYTMIDTLVDKAMGEATSSSPKFSSPMSMDRDLLTFMARHMAGEVTMLEMPNNLRAMFDTMYTEFSNKRVKFKEALQSACEFMDGDKWFFMNNVNDGVILGAIGKQPMLAALENYMNHGSLPQSCEFNFCDTIVPFKWYPSFQDIPDQYRRELEYSLVMLKAHRGSDEFIPEAGVRQFWQEMGCYSAGNVHILHR